MTWAQGFFEVDPRDVRVPTPRDDDFHVKGYDRRTMESWISDLLAIQSRRASGWTERDFDGMKERRDPSTSRLLATYDNFYREGNGNAVRLAWVGDHYEAENGNKRVWLAQQAGLSRIPATIKARDRETLERIRLASLGEQIRQRARAPQSPYQVDRSERRRERER